MRCPKIWERTPEDEVSEDLGENPEDKVSDEWAENPDEAVTGEEADWNSTSDDSADDGNWIDTSDYSDWGDGYDSYDGDFAA